MMNKLAMSFGVLLCLCVGCSKNADDTGEYRRSDDGSVEILYVKKRMALLFSVELNKGAIVLSHAIRFSSIKGATPDQIEEVLVEDIKSINEGQGILFGERYGAADGKQFFVVSGGKVDYFSSSEALFRKLGRTAGGTGELLSCREFMKQFRARVAFKNGKETPR
jgi:hypothetical protein